jgi:ribosomal protein S18 acetylase RimI-like enzyme|tara:strand:- start:674 stop:1171 length:498 start_codon:yes stop_codon:yes gene_type:complete
VTLASNKNHSLTYRKAQPWEMDWAYQIFKTGMQSYITRTWGWNELFQEHSFYANLPPSSFIIASTATQTLETVDPEQPAGVDIGGYCLKQKADHLYLEMLLVDPAWQRQGYGSTIMTEVLKQADSVDLPVRLSVLKINPAFRFYHRLGFVIETEDEIRYRMVRAA